MTAGDEIAGVLSCLSNHYVKQEVDFIDKKLRPLACNGCAWSRLCHEITAVIREG